MASPGIPVDMELKKVI